MKPRSPHRNGTFRLRAYIGEVLTQPGLAVVEPEWLHTTLLHGGPLREYRDGEIEEIARRTREACERVSPFWMAYDRPAVGNVAVERGGWPGRPGQALHDLVALIHDEVTEGRFPRIPADWYPHTSLAYAAGEDAATVNRQRLKLALSDVEAETVAVRVDRITLVAQTHDSWYQLTWRQLDYVRLTGREPRRVPADIESLTIDDKAAGAAVHERLHATRPTIDRLVPGPRCMLEVPPTVREELTAYGAAAMAAACWAAGTPVTELTPTSRPDGRRSFAYQRDTPPTGQHEAVLVLAVLRYSEYLLGLRGQGHHAELRDCHSLSHFLEWQSLLPGIAEGRIDLDPADEYVLSLFHAGLTAGVDALHAELQGRPTHTFTADEINAILSTAVDRSALPSAIG